jgi:hypothetical protein
VQVKQQLIILSALAGIMREAIKSSESVSLPIMKWLFYLLNFNKVEDRLLLSL